MNEVKIYLVKFKNFPNIIYIGNTHSELIKRLQNHKYHKTSLNIYITKNNISWDDVYIELYETFQYNNRKEYEDKETEVIKLFQENINYNVINTNKNKLNNTYNIKKDIYLFLVKKLNDIIKEDIKEYNLNSKKINCECGGCYTYKGKSSHLKSKKHQIFITLY